MTAWMVFLIDLVAAGMIDPFCRICELLSNPGNTCGIDEGRTHTQKKWSHAFVVRGQTSGREGGLNRSKNHYCSGQDANFSIPTETTTLCFFFSS